MQTLGIWENSPIVYARHPTSLALIVPDLCEDIANAFHGAYLRLSVSSWQSGIQDGFISDVLKPPCGHVSLLLSPKSATPVLYCGKLPDFLNLCDMLVPIRVVTDSSRRKHDSRAAMLSLIYVLVSNIKLAALTVKEAPRIESALTTLSKVVQAVKDDSLEEAHLGAHLSPHERVAHTKATRKVVHEAEHLLRSLLDNVRQAAVDMTADQQAIWLTHTSSMRFGARVVTRAQLADANGIIVELTKLDLQGLSGTSADPVGWLSQRSVVQHLQDIVVNPPLSNMTLTDLLYAYGCTGLQIAVRRSEASNVNPWYIAVRKTHKKQKERVVWVKDY